MNLFEIQILDWIQNVFGCKALDTIMPIISMLGDYGIVCIALSLLLIAIPKTRKMGIASLLSLLLGLIVGNMILKPLIFRVRPYNVNTAFKLVTTSLTADGSFPSGHTMAVFETSTVFMKKDKRFGIPALILAISVAFSRLYLYVHYPTDVLAGTALGIILGIVAVWLVEKLSKKYDLDTKLKMK